MEEYPQRTVRLDRKEAVGMDVLIKAWLRSNRLTGKVNTSRIYTAWDDVSGAAPYTLHRFYRGGRNSSTRSISPWPRTRFSPRATARWASYKT